jgi:hypothetical protein
MATENLWQYKMKQKYAGAVRIFFFESFHLNKSLNKQALDDVVKRQLLISGKCN